MTLTERLYQLQPEKLLELNQKLQAKKKIFRDRLHDKGRIQRDAKNSYDKYTYLSEAGYKELMTELLPAAGLDLHSTQISTEEIDGTNNQSNGKRVTWRFTLFDTETGFGEESEVVGEAYDRSDKAIYKADTGAMKYFIANTFLVASGDDAEKESPEVPVTKKRSTGNKNKQPKPVQQQRPANPGRQGGAGKLATDEQKRALMDLYSPEDLEHINFSTLTFERAQQGIDKAYEANQQKQPS